MAQQIDYRKLFGVQKALEKQLKQLCPEIDNKSGIYFWIRKEEGKNCAYIGKAVNLLRRNVSHLQGNQQRIDGSLKKRGLYSEDNTLGWQLFFLHFPEDQLDKQEQHFIEKYRNAGYEMYNIESGGTDGKEIIGERKEGKGYRDGLKQGRENLRKELAHIIEKHLIIYVKKDTIPHQKALAKFHKLLEEPKEDKGEENGNIQQD
jgi:hypothetical protein